MKLFSRRRAAKADLRPDGVELHVVADVSDRLANLEIMLREEIARLERRGGGGSHLWADA